MLSKSTKSYDRDEKFSADRTIPTFQEYLLIDQYTPHVEQYSKTDSQKWIFSEYDGLESSRVLASLPVEIRLVYIYEGIESHFNLDRSAWRNDLDVLTIGWRNSLKEKHHE